MATSSQGICKENISLYLAAFKACRRSRRMSPLKPSREILKTVLIFHSPTGNSKKPQPRNTHSKRSATTFLFMSEVLILEAGGYVADFGHIDLP